MVIFDGTEHAAVLEQALQRRMNQLKLQTSGTPTIAAVVFDEDLGSQLYTRLKKEAAARLGINYEAIHFSLSQANTTSDLIFAELERLNRDERITGIIIQKPPRRVWQQSFAAGDSATQKQRYVQWWNSLMRAVHPGKDVDGLHPENIAAVEQGVWREQGTLLPATCRAVLYALESARTEAQLQLLSDLGKVVILGRSDLLGVPLHAVLKHQRVRSELIGVKELQDRVQSGLLLHDADVVVSATGQAGLITGDLLKKDAVVIDVGEPQPDVQFHSVVAKARFVTPVPGGIGPLTVSFLMANALDLAERTAIQTAKNNP